MSNVSKYVNGVKASPSEIFRTRELVQITNFGPFVLEIMFQECPDHLNLFSEKFALDFFIKLRTIFFLKKDFVL